MRFSQLAYELLEGTKQYIGATRTILRNERGQFAGSVGKILHPQFPNIGMKGETNGWGGKANWIFIGNRKSYASQWFTPKIENGNIIGLDKQFPYPRNKQSVLMDLYIDKSYPNEVYGRGFIDLPDGRKGIGQNIFSVKATHGNSIEPKYCRAIEDVCKRQYKGKLYHGTGPNELDNILKTGFLPCQYSKGDKWHGITPYPPRTFFVTKGNIEEAMNFAGGGYIIEIEHNGFIYPDLNQLNAVFVKGRIPSSRITGIYRTNMAEAHDNVRAVNYEKGKYSPFPEEEDIIHVADRWAPRMRRRK